MYYSEGLSLAGFFGVFGVFSFLIFLIPIAFYVINSLALMKIAEDRGNDKGWLAWIPIAGLFVIPMLIENDVSESMRGKYTLIFGVTLAVTIIPFIGFLASIALTVLNFYGFYILVRQYSSNAGSHLAISIITLGISMPISLFRIRNRNQLAIQ